MGVILALATLPRLWAAVWDQGIFWPDEIFQSIEQAHRLAFGYGFVPWEFQDGARSWLFPGVLGLFWKALAALGVRSAPVLIVSAKLLMVVLALAGVYAAMRIGELLGGPEAGVLSGVLAALFPPSIVYGSRCMTEMASGPLCLIAVLLAFDTRRWRLVLAGCVAALAIYLRYQNGLIAVGLLGWLLAERRGRAALAFALGAVMIGVAGGFLDLYTWGAPFHSLLAYVRFNLIEGRSAAFGVEPPAYYLEVFWSAVGVSSVAVGLGLLASTRRAPGLLGIVFLYVVAHTLVPHKEFRFLMPIMPLMLTLSGVGLARLIGHLLARPDVTRAPGRRRRQRRSGDPGGSPTPAVTRVRAPIWVVAGVLAVAMAWRSAHASFDDFGQRGRAPFSGVQPLWHTQEAVNRLLWAASTQPDLCGLGLVGYGPVWTGGYAYLHRDVPMLWATPNDALAQPHLGTLGAATNYVLTHANVALPAEYATVRTIGAAKLAHRSGSCAPPPASYTRRFPK
jgi:phosphatidylinositol glycan class B